MATKTKSSFLSILFVLVVLVVAATALLPDEIIPPFGQPRDGRTVFVEVNFDRTPRKPPVGIGLVTPESTQMEMHSASNGHWDRTLYLLPGQVVDLVAKQENPGWLECRIRSNGRVVARDENSDRHPNTAFYRASV